MSAPPSTPQNPTAPAPGGPDASAAPGDRRPPRRRRRLALALASVLLVVGITGPALWALDRFVIPHAEVTAASEQSGTTTATQYDTSDATVTDSSYSSDAADVSVKKVTTGSGADTVTYYVADVTLSDATVLKSAFAEDTFGENITQTTSRMAEDNGAVFAINGDYYGFRDSGIEIRNGVIYRDEGAREGLAFYADGHVEVYDETQTTAQQLVDAGVWNTVSFGPAIVEDGQTVAGIESTEVDTNFGNHSIQGDQPRTAVGVIDDNHLVFVVVDGRDTGYSKGVTLPELASIMEGLGATTAYNLDGGGSSTMYFDGEVVNQPSNGGERGTSDILYIAR